MQLRSVDPGGDIARALPSEKIVGAVVNMSCSSPKPGCVFRTAGNRITIGSIMTASDHDDRLQMVDDVLCDAGFDVVRHEQIREIVWYKLLGNASFNPISALTRATGDRIATDPEVRAICIQMMNEAKSVAAAFGLTVSGSPDSRLAVAESLGKFKTSMLQDAEAARPLEYSALIGAIVEIADHFNVAVPVTRVVHGLVQLLDVVTQSESAEMVVPDVSAHKLGESAFGPRDYARN